MSSILEKTTAASPYKAETIMDKIEIINDIITGINQRLTSIMRVTERDNRVAEVRSPVSEGLDTIIYALREIYTSIDI